MSERTDFQKGYAAFHLSLASHYRRERNRAEDCLADIVKLVCEAPPIIGDPDPLRAIAERLQAYYERQS